MRRLELGRYDARHRGVVLTAARLRYDSRLVEPGDLLVVCARDRAEADRISACALDHGAAGVLVDAALATARPGVHPITRLHDVLGDLADDFTGAPSAALSLVGVTGTNGKTSTVQLLGQAWEVLGTISASIGTLGAGLHGRLQVTSGLTTPPVTEFHELLAEFRAAGATAVATEVSSHALEQGRVRGARFDVVAFTNLTRDHLDYHGSMEAYGAAKARILELRGVETAVLNLDDDFIRDVAVPEGVEIVGVSSAGADDAVVRADRIRLGIDGLCFDLVIDGVAHRVRSALIGRFNVDNLIMCAGVLHAQGVPADRIAAVLARLQPVLGRMNRIRPAADGPLVVVDYAHTPDALQQSLAALAEHRYGRIVTVFGCTGDRDRGKRPIMAGIAEAGSDAVIVTDDDVHHEDGDRIVADIMAGFAHPTDVDVVRDRASAIRRAIGLAGPRDVVLIAGKGHETCQVIGDVRIAYSDSETVRDAFVDRRPFVI